MNCERSEQEGEEKWFPFNGSHLLALYVLCIGERSEAVNCERSEQEGEEKWFPFAGFQLLAPLFRIGEQKRWLL